MQETYHRQMNRQQSNPLPSTSGILLVNKPKGKTAFSLVSRLRKILNVKKIGHAGTLDPFATGVMVMLIGQQYTRLSDRFLNADKEYVAELKLGTATDTHDPEGVVTFESDIEPLEEGIDKVLETFQGEIQQIPPMYSAKKQQGRKLYELARKGHEVERQPVNIIVKTTKVAYHYPVLTLHISCSKGTYIRTIADDIGKSLGCGAYLTNLQRTRSGSFYLEQCIDGSILFEDDVDADHIRSCLVKHCE